MNRTHPIEQPGGRPKELHEMEGFYGKKRGARAPLQEEKKGWGGDHICFSLEEEKGEDFYHADRRSMEDGEGICDK